MNSRRFALVVVVGVSATLTLILLWMLSIPGSQATAMPAPPLSNAPALRYVCITGTNSGDCTDSRSPCRTVQYAVDQASEGNVIKVASGTYTGVMARPRNDVYSGGIVTQVVHITKSIAIRGGYTTTDGFADPPDPVANPTTLDAQGQGRVIYIGRAASVTVAGLRITGGDAITPAGGPHNLDAGGGVYIAGGTATLRDNAVFGNVAQYGGGICVIDGTASLSGNRTFGNVAGGPGGGMYVGNLDYVPDRPVPGTTVAIVGDRIFDNTAGSNGGGLCAANTGYDYSKVMLNLTDNQVFSNTAGGSGGGVIIGCGHPAQTGGCDATLRGNLVAGNRAEAGGGGMILSHLFPTAFDRNVFISNTADTGGGLHLANHNGGTYANTTIVGNRAHTAGSGLYMRASWPRLLHTTVARNHGGDGSGIYINSNPIGDIVLLEGATLVNTIVASQTVGIKTEDAAWSSPLTTEMSGVLWFGNGVNISGTGSVSVTRAYTGNPDFAAGGDYHIGPDSAAIDVGVDAGVDHDMDGERRPAGAGYDIGADEYTPALMVSKRAYPDPVQPGAALTYTIHVTNTTDDPLHATITDTLPLSVTLEEASGGTLILPGGTLAPPDGTVLLPDGRVAVVWMDVFIAPDGTWRGTIVVTVDEGYSGPLSNLVEVTTKEGAAGAYIETATVLQPVYLPLVLKNAGATTIEGEYLLVGNPCTTAPCLPGMVYAVLADHTNYYLTVEGAWLWENRAWDGYEPQIGDFVTVTGHVDEKTDVFGDPFCNIEVASLEPALPPPTTTENVAITDIQASGTGDQDPDEYVEIRNDDAQSVQLNGWTLHNAENRRVFTFPGHLMQPGQVCRVYTNEDHPEWCGFSFGSESDVWRYANGCAYLRDSMGTLVDAYCYCQAHTAYLILSATTTELKVGEEVTATVTLLNRGCTSLGLPQYRLYVQSDEPEPIFDPSNPGPVTHYMGVAPGQSDGTEFTLQAIGPGQATLSASASFEVHLGYPGPAYWGYSSAGPLAITVMP
jgi:uncharacterized repeat protein (TIGR01451 family)